MNAEGIEDVQPDETGKKIGLIFEYIREQNLTLEDLSDLLAYLDKQETVLPLINPTLYREVRDEIQAGKNKVKALIPILEQLLEEEAMYNEKERN